MLGLLSIGKINWKDAAQNLIITLIAVIFGIIIGYKISIKSQESTLKMLMPTIETAIKKETTAIHNTVKTEIRKIKSNKGEAITIDVKPNLDGEIETIEIKTSDSIPTENKSWWKKTFGKKK